MIDYPAHLEMMWQKAIAPRKKNAPKVISTFAGGGGSLTGYMMAGYDDVLAVEWDNNAVETLRLNWPSLDIYHGDIAKLSVEEVLKRTGLKVGELDLLDGSPPCQVFSTAGKRLMDDPRNQLFREYVRLLRGLMPKVFVIENVSGMVKGKMKLVFVEILKELKASGYKVKACLMNAMYFHVPQSRERMIFIGVREDLGIEPSHPSVESGKCNFMEAVRGSTEKHKSRYITHPYMIEYAKHHTGAWSTDNVLYRKIKGNVTGAMSTKWASWGEVVGTLVKSEISNAGVVHPSKERYLDLCEAMRCGSFPDRYIFTDRENGIIRIGNSVPPLFMEAIARHIRSNILDQIDRINPANHKIHNG